MVPRSSTSNCDRYSAFAVYLGVTAAPTAVVNVNINMSELRWRGTATGEFPLIASVQEHGMLNDALESDVARINLLVGDINSLAGMVARIHDAGKTAHVHLELVGGISRDGAAVQFLAEHVGVDGVITTKSAAVAAARKLGIASVQRFFAVDTHAVENAMRQVHASRPTEVEVMPGLMPRVIRDLRASIQQPLIVGGLIRNPDEIDAVLDCGADYVSTGNPALWRRRRSRIHTRVA